MLTLLSIPPACIQREASPAIIIPFTPNVVVVFHAATVYCFILKEHIGFPKTQLSGGLPESVGLRSKSDRAVLTTCMCVSAH